MRKINEIKDRTNHYATLKVDKRSQGMVTKIKEYVIINLHRFLSH